MRRNLLPLFLWKEVSELPSGFHKPIQAFTPLRCITCMPENADPQAESSTLPETLIRNWSESHFPIRPFLPPLTRCTWKNTIEIRILSLFIFRPIFISSGSRTHNPSFASASSLGTPTGQSIPSRPHFSWLQIK
jgi:hypothetical protein